MNIEKITQEIKDVRINLALMHASEEEHLARLFFGEIMENGWYGMDEVAKVLKNLNYPKMIKDDIENIANVICCLRDPDNCIGRMPKSYVRVMRHFLKISS